MVALGTPAGPLDTGAFERLTAPLCLGLRDSTERTGRGRVAQACQQKTPKPIFWRLQDFSLNFRGAPSWPRVIVSA